MVLIAGEPGTAGKGIFQGDLSGAFRDRVPNELME